MAESKCSSEKGKREDLWNQPDNFSQIPGKAMLQMIPEITSKHGKDKKQITNSKHRLMKGKFTLTAFCKRMTALLHQGKAGAYPDLRKASDTDSHSIFTEKPRKHKLDKQHQLAAEQLSREGCVVMMDKLSTSQQCSALLKHIWGVGVRSELPSTREPWTYWSKSSEGLQR